MRTVLVENDSGFAARTQAALERAGFNVESTTSGMDGADIIKRYDFDLAIVGVSLPDMSGLEVLRKTRLAKVWTPLICTACTEDRLPMLEALRSGADDYLVRPVHAEELVARAITVVRRSLGHATSVITVGRLSLDLNLREVAVDGIPIHITGTQYRILEVLMLRRNAIVTKERLLDHLYGGMDEPDPKTLDVFVSKLRKQLERSGLKNFVQTVWGTGLIIRVPKEADRPAIPVGRPLRAVTG